MKATVTEYLQRDHERLDAIVEEVRSLVSSGSFDSARVRFADVVAGLGRHIDAEEKILFPAFEETTGMTSGPTVVMRSEHAAIRRLLDTAFASIDSADAVAAVESIEALTAVLGAHNQKEERVLYPMTDRALGEDEARDVLVSRLRSLLDVSMGGR